MGRTRRRGGKSIFSDAFEYVTGPPKTPKERAIVQITKDLDATKSTFTKEKESIDKEIAENDSKSKDPALRTKKSNVADALSKIDALIEAFKYTFDVKPPVATPVAPTPKLTPLPALSDSPLPESPLTASSLAALPTTSYGADLGTNMGGPGYAGQDFNNIPGYAGQDMGPGYAGQDMGPGYAGQDMGPGYAGQDMGPGYAGQDMGPGYAGQDFNNIPGYAGQDMGPGYTGPDFNNIPGYAGPDFNNVGPSDFMGPDYGAMGPPSLNGSNPRVDMYQKGGSRRLARNRKRRSLRLRR